MWGTWGTIVNRQVDRQPHHAPLIVSESVKEQIVADIYGSTFYNRFSIKFIFFLFEFFQHLISNVISVELWIKTIYIDREHVERSEDCRWLHTIKTCTHFYSFSSVQFKNNWLTWHDGITLYEQLQ